MGLGTRVSRTLDFAQKRKRGEEIDSPSGNFGGRSWRNRRFWHFFAIEGKGKVKILARVRWRIGRRNGGRPLMVEEMDFLQNKKAT